MKLAQKGFVSLIILIVSVIIILIIVSLVLKKWPGQQAGEQNKNPQEQVNDVKKQMEDINKNREKMYNSGNNP